MATSVETFVNRRTPEVTLDPDAYAKGRAQMTNSPDTILIRDQEYNANGRTSARRENKLAGLAAVVLR